MDKMPYHGKCSSAFPAFQSQLSKSTPKSFHQCMGSSSETSTNYYGLNFLMDNSDKNYVPCSQENNTYTSQFRDYIPCSQINLNNAYDVDLEEYYSASNQEVAPDLGLNSCPQHDSDMEEIIPLTQTVENEITNEDITKEIREELWPKNVVQTLILKFEDVYVNLNHGNLCKKHWDKLANDVNHECRTSFTGIQCKYKWNRLKRTFKKEKQMENNTGGKPSTWNFYNDMERIIGKTPKVIGLMEGFNGKKWVNLNTSTTEKETEEMGKSHEEDVSMNIEDIEEENAHKKTQLNKKGIECKRIKRRRKSNEELGEKMEKSIMHFTETMKEIEQGRLQLEHAKMEQESKRMDKILDVQLQIAKLFAQVNDIYSFAAIIGK